MNLTQVKNGQICVVTNLLAQGAMLQKLLDMGFTQKSEVVVLQDAPLFDPIEIKIQNYIVALRKSEASLIEVEPK